MITNDESASQGWKEYRGNEPVRAILVHAKDGYHLPSWAHYRLAEGNANEVSILFSTCTVVVRGTGLDALLRKLIFQRISELFIPNRADRMRHTGDASCITELTVEARKSRG